MSTIPETTPRKGYHQPDLLGAQLAATSNEGLLRTFADLTHRIHECRGSQVAGQCDGPCTDLRTQRNAVEAELLRRMTIADTAYSEGVDAGAAQAGRVAAAAMCGASA